jgi:hypothetical protein
MDIWETRRENMRRLIAATNSRAKGVSAKLGFANSSYVVQMAGPNPSRPISERNARTFELKLGLEPGALDRPLPDEYLALVSSKAVVLHKPMSDVDLGVLIQAVTKVLQDENVELPTAKFATLLTLVVNDAKEHGGEARRDVIKSLVDLAR